MNTVIIIAKIRDNLACDYLHTFAIIIAEIGIYQDFEDNLVTTPATGDGGERRRYCPK